MLLLYIGLTFQVNIRRLLCLSRRKRKSQRIHLCEDLIDRLAAHVTNLAEVLHGLRTEICDGVDAVSILAVVRTNAELELVDAHVIDITCIGLRLTATLGIDAGRLCSIHVCKQLKVRLEDTCGKGYGILR